eukprot:s94_g70.t1
MALTSWSYQPLLCSPSLQGSFSKGSQAGVCCQILFKTDAPAQSTKRDLLAVFITWCEKETCACSEAVVLGVFFYTLDAVAADPRVCEHDAER